MTDARIYLDLAPELRRLLDDDGFTIQDVLQREGVDVPIDILEEELPASDDGERERDIGLLIVSSAAAMSMLILALSKYFKDREHAPMAVVNYVVEEITGPDGKTKRVLVPKHEFVQPATAANSTEIEAKIGLQDGAVVKFKVEEHPDL